MTEIQTHQHDNQFAALNATTSIETLYRSLHALESPFGTVEQALQNSGAVIRNNTIHPKSSDTDSSLQIRPVDLALVERGLDHFHAVTEDYFHASLPDCFNWDEVAERLGSEWEGEWFLVAFRSVRNHFADAKQLYDADALAHSEALESGGLLKYWYGSLNEKRECLAMCIWSSRDFAKLATRKPYHILAMSLAGRMYESYTLERWSLIKKKGEKTFHLEQFKIMQFPLLRSECSVAGGALPSMASVTFYNGTPPISFLRSRVSEIMHQNPFLAGRFDQPSEKGANLQFHVPCSEAGTLYALDLDTHFKLFENVAITAHDDFVSVCNAVGKLQCLAVPNAAKCLATNEAVFRVAVLIHPNKKQFALYFTLCHGIGDGHCYYSLYKMLHKSTAPFRMTFARVPTYQEDVWSVLPDVAVDLSNDANMGLPVFGSLLGLVSCVLSSAVRDAVSVYWYGKTVWGVADGPEESWIREQKSEAVAKGGFVSTNDCFTSWFLKKTGCEYGSLAVNTRNRVPNVTDGHFGNYLTLVYYKRADFASPSLIRESVSGGVMKRSVTTDAFDSRAFKRIGFVTNWAGFYEDVELEGCELVKHLPVMDVAQPNPYATCIIFAEKKGHLKVISNFVDLL
ncbi:hypothetical protein HDU98_012041 [Podochytrium sp. JEL0797]|nr:hypothetical protein HDU98_012041 [Podochytrium sp. JEL0797]